MYVRRRLIAPLLVIAIVAIAWISLGMVVTNSYYQLMLTLVPIWAVMGLSWNLLSGYTGLISFGHAAFFGLGAYTVTIALVRFDITPWLGIPLGMIVGTVAGIVIGYPTFRLRGHYFALAMLAYPMALLYVFVWLGYQEVPLPMKREEPAFYMQFSDYRVYIALAVGLLVVSLLISLAVERSRFGMSLTAIKQNEAAAEAAGIGHLRTHTFRHTYRTWLDSVGTPVGVQQRLMRHADIRTTMNIYGDVVTPDMREASGKVAMLALNGR